MLLGFLLATLLRSGAGAHGSSRGFLFPDQSEPEPEPESMVGRWLTAAGFVLLPLSCA